MTNLPETIARTEARLLGHRALGFASEPQLPIEDVELLLLAARRVVAMERVGGMIGQIREHIAEYGAANTASAHYRSLEALLDAAANGTARGLVWRTDPPPPGDHILLHRPPGIWPPLIPGVDHWMPLPSPPGPPEEFVFMKLYEKRGDEP